MFIIADRVHLSACADCRDRSPVSVRQRCHTVSADEPFIVERRQADLVDIVSVHAVFVGSNRVHGNLLNTHLAQASLVVGKKEFVRDRLLHALRGVISVLLSLTVDVLDGIKFRSQTDKPRHAGTIEFVFEFSNHLSIRIVVQ